MKKVIFALITLSACAAGGEEPSDYRFDNGRWFDGKTFVERTAHVRDGRLFFTDSENIRAEQTIDLQQGYVIPPYCEAHNHNLAVGNPEEKRNRYLAHGVFYVKIPNNAAHLAEAEAAFYNTPDSIDVSFSQGGLTGVGGHPVELLEGIRRGGGYGAIDTLADNAYFEIGDETSLAEKWPLLLAQKPGFVKVFLQNSGDYDALKDDAVAFRKRGIDPALVPEIVRRARATGLRVTAHVTTAHDFRVAVNAGVDEIAHLPGYMSPEHLTTDDARAAAKAGVTVVTTAGLAGAFNEGDALESVRRAQADNLRILRDAGVKLAVGSDSWPDTSHGEAAYLKSLNVFDNAELLRMWTENCARSVFPGRNIGRLTDGSEANFIVLNGDPLADFDNTRRIARRVKSGQTLETE